MFTFNEALGKKPPGKEPSGRIAGTFKIQKSVDEKRLAFGWASVAATAATIPLPSPWTASPARPATPTPGRRE